MITRTSLVACPVSLLHMQHIGHSGQLVQRFHSLLFYLTFQFGRMWQTALCTFTNHWKVAGLDLLVVNVEDNTTFSKFSNI